MAVRARGLTSFKILFYLYHLSEGATTREITEDLVRVGTYPYTIKNSLSRLKRLGILVYDENKRYNLNKDLRSMLDEIVKIASSRKMNQVNPNEVIP